MAEKYDYDTYDWLQDEKPKTSEPSSFGSKIGKEAMKVGGGLLGLLDYTRMPGYMIQNAAFDIKDYFDGNKYPSRTRLSDMARFTNLPSSKEAFARSGHDISDWESLGWDISQEFMNPVNYIPALAPLKFGNIAKKGAKITSEGLKGAKKVSGPLLNYAAKSPSIQNIVEHPAYGLTKGAGKFLGNTAVDVLKNKPLGMARRANYWLQGGALQPVDDALEVLKKKKPMSLTNYFKKNNLWPSSIKNAYYTVDKQLKKVFNKRENFLNKIEKIPKLKNVHVEFPNFGRKYLKKARAANVNRDVLVKMSNLYKNAATDLSNYNRKIYGQGYAAPSISNIKSFRQADEVLQSLGDFMSKEKNREVIGSKEGRDLIKALYSDIRDAQRKFLKTSVGSKAVKEFNNITDELDLLINSREPLASLASSGAKESSQFLGNVNTLGRSAQLGLGLNYFIVPTPRLGQNALMSGAYGARGFSTLLEPAAKQGIQSLKGKPIPTDYVTKKQEKKSNQLPDYDTFDWLGE